MKRVVLLMVALAGSCLYASSSSSDSFPSSSSSTKQFSLFDDAEESASKQPQSFEQARLEVLMDQMKYGDTVKYFKEHEQQIAALRQQVDKLLAAQKRAKKKVEALQKKMVALEQQVVALDQKQNVADV